ncbi:MAG: hypothetical protein PHV37_02160 [Candidatus Gastranaerophilales bacterium]|nr:hypothetical protein [Candidatus Gastranaerophilales bacterium]
MQTLPTKLLAQLYNSHQVDNMLIGLGAVGWLVSMLAQVTAVSSNKNLDPKKKQYLLSQEIAEGTVNTTLYLGLTTVASKLIKSAVNKGKILTKTSIDAIDEFVAKNGKATRSEVLNELSQNGVKNINNVFKDLDVSSIKNTAGDLGLIATIVASVVSCNICAPLCRNFVSAKIQNKKGQTNAMQPITAPSAPATTAQQPLKHNVLPKAYNTNTFSAFNTISL